MAKILVIDDDAEVCELIEEVAKGLGISCVCALTAERFFAELREDVSVILVDLVMPGMDGIQILRILGQQRCQASIIVMSGIGKSVIDSAEMLGSTLGLSILGNLTKPFRVAELEGLLKRSPRTPVEKRKSVRVATAVDKAELEGALEREEFVVHYQPQMSIDGKTCVGVEALVRWQHPMRGLVYPDDFIGFIEAYDLMEGLTWNVIRQGLRDLTEFRVAGGKDLTISINLSVFSLRDLTFPDKLLAVAAEYGHNPAGMVLEITESGLMREVAQALDVVTRLRMKLFRLSIDDFGTGYSMMQQLSRIPATELKIDRCFVQQMEHAKDRVMVEKTIEIGHELGMRVIAEGVETEAQLEFLRRKSCDLAQGYLFSKPLPKEVLLEWFEARVVACPDAA